MSRADLQRVIFDAFTGPPPPLSELIAGDRDYFEAAEIRRVLRGRRWTAVPRNTPIVEHSGLSWLSPAGVRHYLPLWTLASLDDGTVRLWTVTQLGLPGQPAQEFARARVATLDAPEAAAVAGFLRFVADHYPDDRSDALTALAWWEARSAGRAL